MKQEPPSHIKKSLQTFKLLWKNDQGELAESKEKWMDTRGRENQSSYSISKAQLLIWQKVRTTIKIRRPNEDCRIQGKIDGLWLS